MEENKDQQQQPEAAATAEQTPATEEAKTPEQLAAEKKAKQEAKKKAKADAKAEKERLKAERKAAEEAKKHSLAKDPNDPSAHLFGERELNRSQCDPELRFQRVYTPVSQLTDALKDQEVRVRGRLHNSRAQSNGCFIVCRDGIDTVQVVLFKSETISKGMVTFAGKIPRESIIEIVATVAVPENPITTTTQQVELQVKELWCVNKSFPVLPFQLEDASRQVLDQAAEGGNVPQASEEEKKDGDAMPVVKQDVRLNNRIIDLRVPTNQAIFRLQSGVCQIYREFMLQNGFIEIHTPKLIAGASEGGANVFQLKYFEQDACLAQSPQLYKQMALCGDLKRVFEIGPVFRAENSNTNRHLCEFTGLDMEMEFKDHYFEVLDLIGELMVYLVENIKTRFAKELAAVNEQYPFEEFVIANPVVKLSFKEGVALLTEAGIEQAPLEDLSTETEKALGRIVKEKYNTDFYMLYGYPVNARPFYTMLDPHDPNYTNSYDFFMRGEEITSGAQRIHDPAMLTERAKACDIPVEQIKDYIEAFKYGAPTHAGAGFGLERIVKFFCNLHNIRKTSLFPRDPQRLTP